MIIQSIRLKNIKSYGEGAEGKGVMILFAPGVNGIAGKNGHGKTTLVESLGYTLFLSKPQSEENLDLDTFFLRAGAKAGEIDVTFSHAGEVFRVERGVGPQSKRRTKVVQVDDGSICAEGEQAVAQFLCKMLGCPHAERLAEMFSKLIGVKQGRLAWPFDSKPKEAKDFFEPLLEVAVFRECFDCLKPAVDEFSELRHKKELIQAGLVQRISERQDSPELVASKRNAASALEKQVGLLTEALEAGKKSKEQLEAKEAGIKDKERQLEAARHAVGLAAQRQKDTEQRVEESLKATEALGKASPSYQAFKATETALKSLRTRQAEQQRLERDKAEAVRKKTELEGTLQVVRARAEGFVEQKAAKEKELAALRGELELLRRHLEQTRPQFEAGKTASGRASEDFSRLRHFIEGLPESLVRQESELKKIHVLSQEIAGWDAAALVSVRQAEAKAEQMLEAAREEVAGAKKRHDTLAEQLKEISGGLCPFLKEKCRQFDPAKVGTDLQQLVAATQASEKKLGPLVAAQQAARGQREALQQQEAALGQKRFQLNDVTGEFVRSLSRLCPEDISTSAQFLQQWSEGIPIFPSPPAPYADGVAEKALEQAFREHRAFSDAIAVWWPVASEQVQTKVKTFQSEEQTRLKEEQNQGFQIAQETRLAKEIDKLQVDEKAQRATAHELETKVGEVAKALGVLEAQLKPFATVNDEIANQEQSLQTHRAGYQQYLEANPLASQLQERQTLLAARREEEAKAAAAAKECEAELVVRRKEFEPRALFEAQKLFLEKNGQVEGQRANLTNAKEELKREEKRFAEWQAACAEREKLDREVTRLRAAMELTEFARKTLRDSAPAVAQHLCNSIAARAQQIFNKINHEPVELHWDATRYSLRISPGERHFAMLSGGEQTKLALAMTLALIQEFSGLRFAVFDEPTYAVDADSREKLAKAILEAQKEAGLEQLIIVSHDDAFEGEIENVVLLRKTARGTEQAGVPGFEMIG